VGFPRKLLGDGEALVLELRPHSKRLLRPAALLLVVAPVATFLAARVPAGGFQVSTRWMIAAAAVLVLLRWSVWPFLVWWNTLYVITDRRLVMRTGVIHRSGHDMPLSRLNDVAFSQGLIDRMLGCGDLVVESAGERGQVVLADIPRVEQVQHTVYRLSDAARSGAGGPFAEDAAAEPDADSGAPRPRRWGRR
jgi:uncharacterized membrane protein YdbT with pleckstrin-like domain